MKSSTIILLVLLIIALACGIGLLFNRRRRRHWRGAGLRASDFGPSWERRSLPQVREVPYGDGPPVQGKEAAGEGDPGQEYN